MFIIVPDYKDGVDKIATDSAGPPLHVFGDSITCGLGASTFSKSWIGLCPPMTMYWAEAGAKAADVSMVLMGVVPDVHKQYIVMIGHNDCLVYGGDESRQDLFKGILLNSLVWLLAGRKSDPPDVSYTGAWPDVRVFWDKTPVPTRVGKAAGTGARASARVSGTAVYIGYMSQKGINATVDVFIDGIKAGSIETIMKHTPREEEWAHAAMRFGNLSPHAHIVEVAVTSPGSENFVLNYIAGAGQSAAPGILLSNIIRPGPAAHAQFSSNDDIVDRYNKIISGVAADLTADGFEVRLVDNHSSIDPVTDLTPDGVHPNDAGHRKIHENFMAAIRGFSSG